VAQAYAKLFDYFIGEVCDEFKGNISGLEGIGILF
jgi:hypothetical protein